MRRALLLALLLVPLASAAAPDPRLLAWTTHPGGDGALHEDPPEPAALAFPASGPGDPPAPLAFPAPAPVAFRFEARAEVFLLVSADKPLVAHDADGGSFDLALLANGTVVAQARAVLPAAVLAPGERVPVRAELPANATVAEGDALELRVTARLPAVPADTLRLVLGAETRLVLPAIRAPHVAALRLQDAPLVEFALADGWAPPSGTVVVTTRVGHDAIHLDPVAPPAGAAVVLVLRGEEDEADAAAHAHANRTRRIEAAHELRVGETVVRVHPGVGVVVPLGRGSDPVRVACERNCPPFEGFLRWADAPPGAVVTDDVSVLVPPPRSTDGIPVSGDAAGKETPLGPLALVALVFAAVARRR